MDPSRASSGPELALAMGRYPPIRRALWLMLLLATGAVLYNVDRLIISVLAEQIRAEVRISDVQMSLLIGAAYSLLSGTFGLVLGFYVDRTIRTRLLAGCLALWSVATIAGGLATGFGWLFLSRSLVGLGEAALAPSVMSLLADTFPPNQRGRAMGVYSLGAVLGGSLSALVPGLIVKANLRLALPGYGVLSPWRVTFVTCGACGLLLVALLMTVREPERLGRIARSGQGGALAGLKLNFGYLARQKIVFIPYILAFGLFYVAFSAITGWTAVFLARRFDTTLAHFSGVLGLMLLTTGVAGYLGGGIVLDAAPLRPPIRKMSVLCLSPLLAAPSALAVLAPTMILAMVMLGSMTVMAPVIFVANNTAVQSLLPNNMRGFTLSLCQATTAVLGVGAGPLLVALVTEHLFHRPQAIGWSLMLVAAPALLASSLSYRVAIAGVRRLIARGGDDAEILRAVL